MRISSHRSGRLLAAACVTAALAGTVGTVVSSGPAAAKQTTTTGATGDFAVTVDGTTYDPAPGRDASVKDVTPRGPVTVRGVHVGFSIDPATLAVDDYTLTGAPSPERMVASPTVVFASKVPQLSVAERGRPTLKELQVHDDTLVAIFTTPAGKLKVQAKDAPQGGIFQMEPEFGHPVEVVHTLGPGLFYFVNAFTGKVNFGDGTDPVTPAQSPTGYHQMLLGKDSPQVATKLFQDGTTTRWSVASGGRMGGVLGEDAIELSAGATSCTSGCQAQNRIRGSVPVPPLPVDPTPLGGQ